MAVRIEGLAEAQRLLADLPVGSQDGQRRLLADSLNDERKGIEARLKASAPRKTGSLRRSIRVRVDKRGPALIISGNRQMVPVNARDGFMSKELNRLGARAATRSSARLQQSIKKILR